MTRDRKFFPTYIFLSPALPVKGTRRTVCNVCIGGGVRVNRKGAETFCVAYSPSKNALGKGKPLPRACCKRCTTLIRPARQGKSSLQPKTRQTERGYFRTQTRAPFRSVNSAHYTATACLAKFPPQFALWKGSSIEPCASNVFLYDTIVPRRQKKSKRLHRLLLKNFTSAHDRRA